MGKRSNVDGAYNRKKKTGEIEEKNIQKTGIIVILMGTILLLGIIIFDEIIVVNINTVVFKIIIDFVSAMATTIITIGAGTVLYGYFDFINYTKKELENIIINDNYVDKLSLDEKKNIINRLEKQVLYGKNVSKGNLYDFVNEEIHTLVNKTYYEYVKLFVNCTKENGRIKKKIIRKFECNYEAQDEYIIDLESITMMIFRQNMTGTKPFVLESLKINGHEMKDKVGYREQEIDSADDYNMSSVYYFLNEMDKKGSNYGKDKRIVFEMQYTTLVDIDDRTMCFRTQIPCKRFETHMHYDSKEMKIFAEIFTFKALTPSGDALNHERIQNIQTVDEIHVEINDWILPGDGIIYIIVLE